MITWKISFEFLLMMLHYDILLHYYWIHDAIPSWPCWVLSWWNICPKWWRYDPMIDKPNNGEDTWRRSQAMEKALCPMHFLLKKLRTVTKKNCFYHLGGNLSTWVLYHIVEYIFPVPMSYYLPRNSKWFDSYWIFKLIHNFWSIEPTSLSRTSGPT